MRALLGFIFFFLHVKNFTTLVFFHVSMDFGMFCNIFSVHEGHLNSWPWSFNQSRFASWRFGSKYLMIATHFMPLEDPYTTLRFFLLNQPFWDFWFCPIDKVTHCILLYNWQTLTLLHPNSLPHASRCTWNPPCGSPCHGVARNSNGPTSLDVKSVINLFASLVWPLCRGLGHPSDSEWRCQIF